MMGRYSRLTKVVRSDVLINAASVTACECYGKNVNPTLSGNQVYAAGDTSAPGIPAWNYKYGVQPNVP